ncbi:MAG: MotA/TolQ/ExbB proton channel family protein [Deltaproteobacteria bacterium]|nr:MotA/TolQ/ExbB proton channel family protein [Deltaproteobacteria bacterium]
MGNHSIVQIFEEGGFFMYVTLLSSVVAVAFMIERAVTLLWAFRIKPAPLKQAIKEAIAEFNISRALQVCALNPEHPLFIVIKAGLMKANRGEKEVLRAMEEATLEVSPRITRLTNYLNMLGNMGTLLGLLGTVFGMIRAFGGLGTADASAKQEILAKGIAEAMYNTGFGLIVAIPCTLAGVFFTNRQERLIQIIDEFTIAVTTSLAAANKDQAAKAAQAGGAPAGRAPTGQAPRA